MVARLMLLIAYRVPKRLQDSLVFKHVCNKSGFVFTPPNRMFSFPSPHNLDLEAVDQCVVTNTGLLFTADEIYMIQCYRCCSSVSPLDFDPSYQAYWSESIRDTLFRASTNALDTNNTGLSFYHPNNCGCLLHALVGHALQSASCSQEAAATFLLPPEWLGWNKNGYMSWMNKYPEHACVLARLSANTQYTITPLINLGIPLHKVHQLANALPAMQ